MSSTTVNFYFSELTGMREVAPTMEVDGRQFSVMDMEQVDATTFVFNCDQDSADFLQRIGEPFMVMLHMLEYRYSFKAICEQTSTRTVMMQVMKPV